MKSILFLLIIFFSFNYGQSQEIILEDMAWIYVPVLKSVYSDWAEQMFSGLWTGETKRDPTGKYVAHGYGKWTVYENGRIVLSVDGKATMGEFNGQIEFSQYVQKQNGYTKYKGEVYHGIPNGYFLFSFADGSEFIANAKMGIISGEAIGSSPELKKPFFCDCFNLTFEELASGKDITKKCTRRQ